MSTQTELSSRRATYAVTINGTAGTATVRICDNGEPGRPDVMEITLSTGYSAGMGTTLGGEANVQLHNPRRTQTEPKPKKPKRNAK